MRSAAVARNYADTLLTLAERHGGEATIDDYGRALDEVVSLLRLEPRVRSFLETPLVSADAKKDALRKTFAGHVPETFLRFLLVLMDKRRAPYLEEIAAQYHEQVDQRRGRVRARVVLAREPDEALRREIRESLTRTVGREVLATYEVDEGLIGGVVVRVADQVFDGSVRRRAAELRRRLLSARFAEPVGV